MVFVHLLLTSLLSLGYDGATLASWLLAFVLVYVLLKLLGLLLPVCRVYAMRVEAGARFVPWFTWKVFSASLDVALIVINPRRQVSSAVVQVKLDTRDRRLVTVIACLLTLTPGTLALSYRPGELFVHVLDTASADPVQQAIHDIELRLMAWVYPMGDKPGGKHDG